ncbi:hypothetical protein [Enterococcus mediterraneensis]|uniref:hypothetical protein n=1 Tax=Enterococcus mediterraneensis TaxID=2364791 RepID=UPI000F06C741|nr:hypothetical protein [Enterococcus mediterraneensis]
MTAQEQIYASLILNHAEMAMDYFLEGTKMIKQGEISKSLRLLNQGQVCLNVANNLERKLFYLEKRSPIKPAEVSSAKECLTTAMHWGEFFESIQNTLEKEI